MDLAQREFMAGVERCFGRVVDPRVIGRCDQQLLDRVAILILVVLCGAEDWPDIEIDGQETWESRLYVSSHPPQAEFLGQAIRRHWSIENSQHWVLDVVFGEDQRRQQDRHSGANLAAVRRLAVSLLRQETTHKRGVKNKRQHCALDPNYMLKVLHTAKF